jgi:hypothetical protein
MLLSKAKGVRCIVTDVDASGAHFLQFKHGLSVYTSIDGLRLGGVAIEGTVKRREDGQTDVVASSTIIPGQCILSSASLLIILGLLSTLLPWVFIALGWRPVVVLLIDVLLWLVSACIWYALLKRIVDDLFNVLKWILHGLSVKD